MSDTQSRSTGPSLTTIEHPSCPNCRGARMSLARIAPGPKGFDVRTFECPKCEYVHIMTVAIDPMKSNAKRWLAADLNPPK
jgi:hypothetical protein